MDLLAATVAIIHVHPRACIIDINVCSLQQTSYPLMDLMPRGSKNIQATFYLLPQTCLSAACHHLPLFCEHICETHYWVMCVPQHDHLSLNVSGENF